MTDTNTAEREAIIRAAVAAMPHTNPLVADDLLGGFTMHTEADDIVAIFQAGRASLAASAGSEPVAVAEVACTHVHGWCTRWIVDADRKLNIPPLGTKLYARPPAPKQGKKDSSRLRKALIRAQQAINSMKVEAETAAQGDKRMMLEACETISNEGLRADMAIRDVLANHPSPPEGMAGWTKASEQLPPCRDNQLYIGVNSAGFAGVFNAVTSIAGNVYCHYETAEESIDVLGDLAIWKQFNPPLPASEAKEL